jgi:hypothetical protein
MLNRRPTARRILRRGSRFFGRVVGIQCAGGVHDGGTGIDAHGHSQSFGDLLLAGAELTHLRAVHCNTVVAAQGDRHRE